MTTDSATSARRFLAAGALLALLSVAAGAFAAHGLKGSLDAYRLGIFETAARYQMYHALALLLVGTLAAIGQFSLAWLRASALAFAGGILLFCGSLYALAFAAPKWFGAVTPLGGLMFIAGWLLLSIAVLKRPKSAAGQDSSER
jgi:uncharacterized membrane protein YgdD (TMEM256/DUF423 family)